MRRARAFAWIASATRFSSAAGRSRPIPQRAGTSRLEWSPRYSARKPQVSADRRSMDDQRRHLHARQLRAQIAGGGDGRDLPSGSRRVVFTPAPAISARCACSSNASRCRRSAARTQACAATLRYVRCYRSGGPGEFAYPEGCAMPRQPERRHSYELPHLSCRAAARVSVTSQSESSRGALLCEEQPLAQRARARPAT